MKLSPTRDHLADTLWLYLMGSEMQGMRQAVMIESIASSGTIRDVDAAYVGWRNGKPSVYKFVSDGDTRKLSFEEPSRLQRHCEG